LRSGEFGTRVAKVQGVRGNQKTNQEQTMSIEKKSLISNRIASKKAIVTKPEGSKVASNKTIVARLSVRPRIAGLNTARVAGFKLGATKVIVR
jgi:hypothetical protein